MTDDPQTPATAALPDNQRCGAEQSPSEIVLSVEHAGRPEHTPDVEEVLLRRETDCVIVTRLDGERFVFDRAELANFLASDAA